MNSTDILSEILCKHKGYCIKKTIINDFIPNKNGDSFYSIQKRGVDKKVVQIRLSNHGTFLKTWVDREELSDSKTRLFDPAQCINISIVFIDDGNDLTKQCVGQGNCDNCAIPQCVPQTFEGQNELGKPFTVKQYVYKSDSILHRYRWSCESHNGSPL